MFAYSHSFIHEFIDVAYRIRNIANGLCAVQCINYHMLDPSKRFEQRNHPAYTLGTQYHIFLHPLW